MLPLLWPQQAQALPLVHLALRGTVAATRLLETLSQRPAAPNAALPSAVAGASSRQQPDSNHASQTSSIEQADSSKVLGVLTSLLQQQQQGSQTLQQQQTAQEFGHNASSALQWPAAGSQALPNPSCQPDLSAASSGQVRMESQLVFDSCWRRFREKHGMDFAAPREIVWLNGAPGSGKVRRLHKTAVAYALSMPHEPVV